MWGKLTDTAAFAPKVLALGNAAYGALTRMFSWACQQRTDGWLPAEVARLIVDRPAQLKQLLTVKANGRGTPLHRPGDECACLEDKAWPPGDGYWLHDFLDSNPSRAENDVHRSKRREMGDRELRRLVRERDGNACRYCGVVVSTAVHRGPRALQVEHIDPRLTDGLLNLVVSCAACNTKKGRNTPKAAGLELLPPPVSVPKGGWKAGDEPTIERCWPADEPTVEPHGPTDDRTVDRTSVGSIDPTPVDGGGTSTSATRGSTTVTSDDATPVESYLGAGGGRVPPDTALGSRASPTRVGPATTPRSPLAPNPYTKANTGNPSPMVVEVADRLGCSIEEAEGVVARSGHAPDRSPRAATGPPGGGDPRAP